MVALNPIRSDQIDRAKAERQPIQRQRRAQWNTVLIPNHDTVGEEVEHARSRSGAARNNAARQRSDGFPIPLVAAGAQHDVPYQRAGLDRGGIRSAEPTSELQSLI